MEGIKNDGNECRHFFCKLYGTVPHPTESDNIYFPGTHG